ncbi:hypothetical protein T03_4030 [Trichinella britovi]|uniref:Uncharacterized protein n=1 Tax=Trichinella britovi TaxID=45882 RepID=A0A0V1C4X6_TRIBR|nr:hypothetical protein T03_4030 [Trichinella britovi]
MFPLLNIISYLEILETNKYALSKPFLENFNEQPASISDVLQLHTEKSIRNVHPILMEEHREHTCLQLKRQYVEIKTILSNSRNFTPVNGVITNGNLFESSS